MPDELYADRGHDSDDTRAPLAWLVIEPRIARCKNAAWERTRESPQSPPGGGANHQLA
ncbi:hypothetical protein [Zavarzinella formosa]|uniref:hypothetical protein n=1 Tax=Zavarzinella formosa TaxID=360055 RepID=UPI0019309BA0|nr:hypothetical protein [Zavarzinella formosa]